MRYHSLKQVKTQAGNPDILTWNLDAFSTLSLQASPLQTVSGKSEKAEGQEQLWVYVQYYTD